MSDHIHILISIPPKYSVAQVVGYIKSKSAIHIAREFLGRKIKFTGQSFGPEAILYLQLIEMKKLFVNTLRNRKQKTGE